LIRQKSVISINFTDNLGKKRSYNRSNIKNKISQNHDEVRRFEHSFLCWFSRRETVICIPHVGQVVVSLFVRIRWVAKLLRVVRWNKTSFAFASVFARCLLFSINSLPASLFWIKQAFVWISSISFGISRSHTGQRSLSLIGNGGRIELILIFFLGERFLAINSSIRRWPLFISLTRIAIKCLKFISKRTNRLIYTNLLLVLVDYYLIDQFHFLVQV
jgi:hypothetical protein